MITAWDRYGPIRSDRDGTAPLPAGPTDLVAYMLLSRRVARIMADLGIRERNWTRFRIASTILAEIQSGEVWPERRRRDVSGCSCGADFRRRLAPLYAAVFKSVNDPRAHARKGHSLDGTDAHRPRTANLPEERHALAA